MRNARAEHISCEWTMDTATHKCQMTKPKFVIKRIKCVSVVQHRKRYVLRFIRICFCFIMSRWPCVVCVSGPSVITNYYIICSMFMYQLHCVFVAFEIGKTQLWVASHYFISYPGACEVPGECLQMFFFFIFSVPSNNDCCAQQIYPTAKKVF